MRSGKGPGFKRCSFSLPSNVAADVASVSEAMGVSQSALVAQVLGDTISSMRELLSMSVPAGADTSSPEVMRRLRGDSVQFVQDRVSAFMDILDGMGDEHEVRQ